MTLRRLALAAACAGFLRHAGQDEVLSFAPELLPIAVGEPPLWLHYQQTAVAPPDDVWQGEPCDRFADAERLWQLACACFEPARSDLETSA